MKIKNWLVLTAVQFLSLFAIVFADPLDQEKDDRQQIIEHVHSIFKAFVKQDKEAIHELHTDDWMGIQNRSRKIVRGLDEYVTASLLTLTIQIVLSSCQEEMAVPNYIC